MTEEGEAVVGQSGRLKKVSDRVRGGETCVFRSVYVDATVDVIVVSKTMGPRSRLRCSLWWS